MYLIGYLKKKMRNDQKNASENKVQLLTAASQKWRFGFQKRLFSIFRIPCPKADLCKTIATFAKPQIVGI
jgi:hypothetical protein